MKSSARLAAAALLAVFAMFDAVSGARTAPPDVQLWRLDCGQFKDFDIEGMSDVFSYSTKKETLADGCYLIRHRKGFLNSTPLSRVSSCVALIRAAPPSSRGQSIEPRSRRFAAT